MKSGIRQGDPLSPPIFSALLGHILRPLIKEWERQGYGAPINPAKPSERVTVLAYADDVTLIAANKDQAAEMLKDLSKALQGINLQLLPEKCSALWTEKPDGSETDKITLGSAKYPFTLHSRSWDKKSRSEKTPITASNTGYDRHGKPRMRMQRY